MRAVDLEPVLADAVAEVLESMCFLSILEKASQCEAGAQQQWVRGTLRFDGVWRGSFGVGAPPETARIIAANFLGEEEASLTAVQTAEVIRELANMACGALLGRIDAKHVFTLSSPQDGTACDPPEASALGDQDRLCCLYNLDEGSLQAWCEIERAK